MVKRLARALAIVLATVGTVSAGETMLLDFSSPRCQPCRQMEPTIDRLMAAGFRIRKVDVSREQALASQYGVSRVPCFVMLVDGQEVDRQVGLTDAGRLEEMLRRGQQRMATPASVTRGQSPDPGTNPWMSGQAAQDRTAPAANSAYAETQTSPGAKIDPSLYPLVNASVRLRVQDAAGHSNATGTIVDTREGEALVVTCGHVFRDSQGQGTVNVELFEMTPSGPQVAAQVPGQVISFDLEKDIALVSIRPGREVQIAPIAAPGADLNQGDSVTNVGCSHGGLPTAASSHVLAVNRYLGPANVEVAGAPVQGRSGGGLFNAAGQLVGVCQAADPQAGEGLYAGLASIHAELDRVGLSEIYRTSSPATTMPTSIPVPPSRDLAPGQVVRGQEPHSDIDETSQNTSRDPTMTADLNPAEAAAWDEIQQRAAESEVICIIRPKQPGGKSEIISLGNVSAEFAQRLRDEGRPSGMAPVGAPPAARQAFAR